MSYDEHVAEVYPAADGWRFRIKASNGEIIATGEAYESKTGATAGVERVHPGITLNYLEGEDDQLPSSGPPH